MRRFRSAVVALSIVPAALAIPVLSRPVPKPHPVAPQVRHATVHVGLNAPVSTAHFSMVGVSWLATPGSQIDVAIRTHTNGAWSDWTDIGGVDDVAPDGGSADLRGHPVRQSTSPVWAGPSDGVQVNVTVQSGHAPHALRLELIDPGTSAADKDLGISTPASSAAAATSQPYVYTRAQWGADESLRSYNGTACATPHYGSTIKVGFVHHTDTSNDYTMSDVPSIIRGIYAYHVESNGWCDIGYNFLVDKFGRIWEGRYGGISKPVIGAHTGGFNTDSFGTSVIGTYSSVGASSAALSGLEHLFAWKLQTYWRDPHGKEVLTAGSFSGSRYAAGTNVTFNVISGHRDADWTTCPGDALYAQLPGIRNAVKSMIGVGFVDPFTSAASTSYAGSPVTAYAHLLQSTNFTLTVKSLTGCSSALVRQVNGSAATYAGATWDLKTSTGTWARPGIYLLTLTGSWGSSSAIPWTTTLEVRAPAPPTVPSGTPATPAAGGFVSMAPIRLLDTRNSAPLGPAGRLDVPVVGVSGVPTTGVTSVLVNVTAVCGTAASQLNVYPTGTKAPASYPVSFNAGQTRANMTVVRVGNAGNISVGNLNGYVDVLVDLLGYFTTSTGGAAYHSIHPVRVYDSRSGTGALTNGEIRNVPIAGVAGLPSTGMAGVIGTVTVVNPKGGGNETVYGSSAPPLTSTVNFSTGEVIANKFESSLTAGALSVRNQGGPADVIIDIVGWFGTQADKTGSWFTPATSPIRLLNSTLTAGTAKAVTVVGGTSGIPSTADGVVMTTAIWNASNGYVTAWDAGSSRPSTSDMNLAGHSIVTDAVLPRVGTGGQIDVESLGSSVSAVGDVVGWFTPR